MKRGAANVAPMPESTGRGNELLGTVLAFVGWATFVLAAVLTFPAVLSDVPERAAAGLSLLGLAVAGMALAGLGHLLRAVARIEARGERERPAALDGATTEARPEG